MMSTLVHPSLNLKQLTIVLRYHDVHRGLADDRDHFIATKRPLWVTAFRLSPYFLCIVTKTLSVFFSCPRILRFELRASGTRSCWVYVRSLIALFWPTEKPSKKEIKCLSFNNWKLFWLRQRSTAKSRSRSSDVCGKEMGSRRKLVARKKMRLMWA